jgi:hypothetical protein
MQSPSPCPPEAKRTTKTATRTADLDVFHLLPEIFDSIVG